MTSRVLSVLVISQLLWSSAVSKLFDIDEVTSEFNNSVYGDNDLWSTLYSRCGGGVGPTYHCVQDSVFTYLDRTLEGDLVTDAVTFTHNDNNYTDICRRVKKDDPGDFNERLGRNLYSSEGDDGFSEFVDKVEEVEGLHTDSSRRGKVLESSIDNNNTNTNNNTRNETKEEESSKEEKVKNIRDVTDILYDRGVKYLMTHDMELALPSFAFGGGRVKISPRGFDEDGGALVKLNVIPEAPQEGRLFFKQIQKLFKKKLMTSMMAAVLIIKLLKLKAMFFLPLLLGVGTAKKLLLKLLLFLFPALTHLFKLCSYYHHKHAKFHHHHHQIAHHHHHVPVPIYTPVHTAPGELPAPYQSYESTGPGGAVYSHSRTEQPGSLADLASWGLGEYPAAWDDLRGSNSLAVAVTELPRYTYPTKAQQIAQTVQYPSQAELTRLYATKVQAPQSQYSQVQSQYSQALAGRLQALTPRPTPASAPDPFYSPMLKRLDVVFGQLGVGDEGCRERLVCSMYKNPSRFSPHSNLVSAELSRDPMELPKPVSASSAVVRFYRYLQAARDGQDHRDCLRLYAACAFTTE